MLKKNRKWLFLLPLLLLLVLVIFFRTLPKEVETVRAERRDVEDYITEDGTLSFGDSYSVISELSAPVKAVLVSEGQEVSPGTELFQLDETDYIYQREQQRAELSSLEAQLQKAELDPLMTASPEEYIGNLKSQLESADAALSALEKDYWAAESLFQSGDISETDREKARAAYEKAKSDAETARARYDRSSQSLRELEKQGISGKKLNEQFYGADRAALQSKIDALNAALSQLDEKIGKASIRANRAGIITALPIRDLSVISAGQEAVRIKGSGEAYVSAKVLSSVAPLLQIGDPVDVKLKLRGSEEHFEGEIAEIRGYAEKGVSALGSDEYRVELRVSLKDSSALSGRDGYGLTLRLRSYEGKNVLTIPAEAVFEENEKHFAYVLQSGRAQKRELSLSYEAGGNAVIESGIEEGEELIRDAGAKGIRDGVRLRGKQKSQGEKEKGKGTEK